MSEKTAEIRVLCVACDAIPSKNLKAGCVEEFSLKVGTGGLKALKQ